MKYIFLVFGDPAICADIDATFTIFCVCPVSACSTAESEDRYIDPLSTTET